MATKTQSLTVPAKDKTGQGCHCGCAPCDGTCCRLDCIVKPHFFCGQLLTDADLSAMLKWARDRFGLSRYRHGWGVVCGLDVRCDPGVPTGVIVTPGYAVDCCGDDIVVCEDAPLDLKGACREEEDPCADLRRQYAKTSDRNVLGRVAGNQPGGMILPYEKDLVRYDKTGDGRRVVDIYLRYDEKPSDPATALGRSSCKQVAECEYSRTRESYKLSWEIGVAGSDPVRARADKWNEGYEQCRDVLKKFRAQFGSNFPGVDVRRWLLRWIDAHPQYRLCNLREKLCKQPDDYFNTEKNLVAELFQLVQNCRVAYLNCDCFGCDEEARVPLARVWVLPDDRASGQECRIIAIDPYPPFRRPIQPECWPAPLGSVNVGRFIWHRWDEVCRGTAELGMHVTRGTFTLPATLAELEMALQCSLFVECDARPVVQVYDAGFLGERVVGFCGQSLPPPPPPLCPDIKLTVPSTVNVGAAFECMAQVDHGDPGVTPTFNWTVSPGTITGGQGTTRISVDTGGLQSGQTVLVTLNVGGYDISCKTTQEGKATITGQTPAPCPDIKLTVPSTADVGDAFECMAQVAGGDPDVTPTFKWTVSQGTISAGQGTTRLSVDTGGLQSGQTVVVTLNVGGYDVSCNTTQEGKTTLTGEAHEDNLTEINLIGPARLKVLNDAGIKTFADLANTPIERLKGLGTGVTEDVLVKWIEEAKTRVR